MPSNAFSLLASRHAIGHCRRCAKSRPCRRMRAHSRSAKHGGGDDMFEGCEAHAESHRKPCSMPLHRAESPWSVIEVLLPPSARPNSSKTPEMVQYCLPYRPAAAGRRHTTDSPIGQLARAKPVGAHPHQRTASTICSGGPRAR
jgi:hypothetical protein